MIRHWPRISRMGIGRRLEDHVYSLLDAAIKVSNPIESQAEKVKILGSMSSRTDCVLVYLRLGLESQDIDQKRYRRLADHVVGIGRQVGGLKKHIAKMSMNV